jgi:predicted O-linked N-acetylglucosamine transferase (SPINDLY family)
MRQRVSAAFDRFIDIGNQSDQGIASLAKCLEIDIAIDLKGFTTNARTGIFALRSAPIQVSYLGYPGTMGAPYIDYLIADPTFIPDEHQQHYTEKIAYLPDSYQVNDSHRQISERQFTRSEVGLPDAGFVFCCFNNNFKITPDVFDIWMQLLKRIDGSVLWLFEDNTQAKQNLLNEAIKRGITANQLVFAPRMDLPDHLARHRLADLFLDTFYCNAHTTASDALWADLPVLTCLGKTFAGRVATSLLNAIGLTELITHSHEEYQALAVELATRPEKLDSIKRLLAHNRITHPLFNAALFTRHIENAYILMQARHQSSLLPDHIYARKNK